jgi:hypothetical protein
MSVDVWNDVISSLDCSDFLSEKLFRWSLFVTNSKRNLMMQELLNLFFFFLKKKIYMHIYIYIYIFVRDIKE